MVEKVRLIIASKGQELTKSIKSGLENKKFIESIITVHEPYYAENKLQKTCINILIWDVDDFTHHVGFVEKLMNRFTFYVIYTSTSRAKTVSIPTTGKEVFLQKPFVYNTVASLRYATNVENHVVAIVRRQQPIPTRNLVKVVNASDEKKIVAVGSSTGGTNALEELLKRLPVDMPPMVVVQHMPSGFTKLFADRLNSMYKQEVIEAKSGDFLMSGRILLAPADMHMRVVKDRGKLAVECFVGSRIHGVMPAADILFESVATVVKDKAVGVILTGMGNDGAKGLLQMRNAGCRNIGQSEETCVVYGMPKAAKDIGAINYELPLDKISDMIMKLTRE